MTRRASADRLSGLHVLADASPRWAHSPVAQARAACAGGASAVQLRAKLAPDRDLLAWAAEIRALTEDAGALFLVNDRFDLALAAGADGAHLGQDDLPPARVPPAARERLLLGFSTHTLEQAAAARREPVDYVAFGPVFGTSSKDSPWGPRGLAQLAEVVRSVRPLPVVAIGGIDASNAASVRVAGAAGFAVISAVAGAREPEAATRALVAAWREGAAGA
ncbi:MAG TPA: thiamine phosphate synthase [Myxococcota bacterium]